LVTAVTSFAGTVQAAQTGGWPLLSCLQLALESTLTTTTATQSRSPRRHRIGHREGCYGDCRKEPCQFHPHLYLTPKTLAACC
jgi:hypothetical protein